MKKTITTILVSLVAFANVLCMNPVTVAAHNDCHTTTCHQTTAKKKCKKKHHTFKDKNHNKKCDKCGKKKSKHCKKHH